VTTTAEDVRLHAAEPRTRTDEHDGRPRQAPSPDLMTALRRYWDFVLLVTIAVFMLSTALGFMLRESAHAEASVALTAPGPKNVLSPGVQGDAALARYTSQRALFTESDQVLELAASRSNLSVDQLRAAVSVTPSSDSTSMVVRVEAGSPEAAVALVDQVVDAYAIATAKQVTDRTNAAQTAIDAQITRLNTVLASNPSEAATESAAITISDLTREAAARQTDSAVFDDGIDFVQAATLDSAVPVGLPVRFMGLGALVGLALACSLAWWRADRDRRLSTASSAEDLLDAPLLGEVPQMRRAVSWPDSSTEVVSHCRDIVGPYLAAGSRGLLLVTGAERGAGCSTVALGIAAAGASEGLNVLVIDADPRTQGLTSLLELPEGLPGLVEAARNPHADLTEHTQDVLLARDLIVSAMPAGSLPDGDWAVTAVGLQTLLTRLRPHYDLIVADAPVPGGEYLASMLTGMADAVVVVVRRDARAALLADMQRLFVLNRARVMGYVYTFSASRRTVLSGRR
jgi:succinoglycan biosynthesis transport protein ExoP